MGTLHFLRAVAPRPNAGASCFQAFDRELDYLYWTLQRLGARPSDTEDLLQDIFAVLYNKWSTLDTTRPLRPWLFGVAFRMVRTYRRRQVRETPRDGLDPLDVAPDPEDSSRNSNLWRCCRPRSSASPKRVARSSCSTISTGVEVVEIARRLSITRFGVYARLRKGRKELASAVRSLQRGRVRA